MPYTEVSSVIKEKKLLSWSLFFLKRQNVQRTHPVQELPKTMASVCSRHLSGCRVYSSLAKSRQSIVERKHKSRGILERQFSLLPFFGSPPPFLCSFCCPMTPLFFHIRGKPFPFLTHITVTALQQDSAGLARPVVVPGWYFNVWVQLGVRGQKVLEGTVCLFKWTDSDDDD